jgi:L-iditol 2-dehydrogenase
MKALVKYAPGNGNVELRDMPEPEGGPGKIILEVGSCGVCGTDIHVLHDTYRNYPPVILGHEFAGTIVEAGPGVSKYKVGDTVAILGATTVTCGECRWCRSGYFIFCPKRRGMGHGVNGAFTKYVAAREDQCYRVPEGLTLEEGAMCEPFAACVQAVLEMTPLRLGDVALVSGPGPIGLLCLKLLAAEGVQTIVAGPSSDAARLHAALRLGAAAVVDLGKDSLDEVVAQHTRGHGVDVAFECAGHPASVKNCLQALRPLGQYTQVGICGCEVQFPIDAIFYKQLKMAGSFAYTAQTWDRMMHLLGQGRIRLNDLISARLPLDQWEQAFRLCMDKEAVKVLIDPKQ